MEEIMEIDQEIKMKQKFIKTRMNMLGKLLPGHQNKKTVGVAEDFLLKVKQEYVDPRPSVTYEKRSEAIPLH